VISASITLEDRNVDVRIVVHRLDLPTLLVEALLVEAARERCPRSVVRDQDVLQAAFGGSRGHLADAV
jgi:hypothetical protein